jgi:hypothetical protein
MAVAMVVSIENHYLCGSAPILCWCFPECAGCALGACADTPV